MKSVPMALAVVAGIYAIAPLTVWGLVAMGPPRMVLEIDRGGVYLWAGGLAALYLVLLWLAMRFFSALFQYADDREQEAERDVS